MSLSDKLIDFLGSHFPKIFDGPGTKYWYKHASITDLVKEREKYRQGAQYGGNIEDKGKYFALDNLITKRRNEKYRKEHPNAKTVHREHGWHLGKDD